MASSSFLNNFGSDRRGNFAVITALLAVPLVGLSGLALDYSRGTNAQDYIQDQGDNIAVSISSKGPTANSSELFKTLVTAAKAGSIYEGVTFTGAWISESDYKVTATLNMPLMLGSVVPGVGKSMAVSTTSIARYQGAKYVYKPPTYTDLSPEAGDYNLISAYCYSGSTGRSQFVEIADNEGKKFGKPMPQCKAGEVLSYLLSNVESGRGNGGATKLKDKGKDSGSQPSGSSFINGTNGIYYYYTDTTLSNGVEKYDLGGLNLLETILCKTRAECNPKDKGGILPNNHQTGRQYSRSLSSEPCAKGKFMYYGWEDRPPGKSRGSDSDFDDIRLVMECPELIVTALENVALIK